MSPSQFETIVTEAVIKCGALYEYGHKQAAVTSLTEVVRIVSEVEKNRIKSNYKNQTVTLSPKSLQAITESIRKDLEHGESTGNEDESIPG